jgi:hypothetical protein
MGAELRLRYSDGSYEDVELLPGEFLDVDELPVIHTQRISGRVESEEG